MWQDVSRIKHSQGSSHPLEGKGRAAYLKYQQFYNTYTYASRYKDKNKKIPALSLFDNRNSWIKQGLDSRIFPVWSVSGFLKHFKTSLFRILVKHYWDQAAAGMLSSIYSADDYWMDVLLYFIDKTRREQLDYDQLVREHEPYCHYPLQHTYKTESELLNGILKLYNEKIRDIFRSVKIKKHSSLSEIEKWIPAAADNRDRVDIIDFVAVIKKQLFKTTCLKTDNEINAFLSYLSLNKPLTKAMHILKKYNYKKSFYRRNEYLFFSKTLAAVFKNYGKQLNTAKLLSSKKKIKAVKAQLQQAVNIYLSAGSDTNV
ncbi:MAG TPA: hypothetical protein VKS21_02645 [Spirochaetota bacterium]|nr:hypothetical protein [Spirochaetota bacterium]